MHPSRLEGAAPPLAALKEEINLKLTISYNFYTFENSPTFPHWKVKLRIWNFYLRLVCQNPIPRDSRRQIEFTECILDAKRVFLLTQDRSLSTLVEVWLRFRSLILVNILRFKSGRNIEAEVWSRSWSCNCNYDNDNYDNYDMLHWREVSALGPVVPLSMIISWQVLVQFLVCRCINEAHSCAYSPQLCSHDCNPRMTIRRSAITRVRGCS